MKDFIEILGIAGCLGIGLWFLEKLGTFLDNLGYKNLSKWR